MGKMNAPFPAGQLLATTRSANPGYHGWQMESVRRLPLDAYHVVKQHFGEGKQEAGSSRSGRTCASRNGEILLDHLYQSTLAKRCIREGPLAVCRCRL